MNNFEEDFRFKWIKYVIYKFFDFNLEDSAFEDIQKEESFQSTLLDFLTQQNLSCIFFYYTIIEDEIENEEAVEKAEEFAQNEFPDALHSDADELEVSSSIEEKDVQEDDIGESSDLAAENDILENEANMELTDKFEEDKQNKESRKKSTTSLMMIVKKIKLHFCLNISKYIPSQSYVYFLRRYNNSLPFMGTEEEVFMRMPQYFEIGYLSQHPLVCVEKVISHLYMPMLEDIKSHVSAETYKIDTDKISSLFVKFNEDLKEFRDSTKEIILQIEKPFMFSLPDIPEDSSLENLSQETVFVTEALYLVNEWNTVLLELIKEVTTKNPSENDLMKEITFWKNQKLKLGVCCNQLSHSDLLKTLEILRLAECDIKEFQKNMVRVDEELIRITDIVDYLLLLELNLKEILSDTTKAERKTLDELFLVLKMLWIQSDYYQKANNMSRLFKGLAEILKNKVKQAARPDELFRMPLEKSKLIISDSVGILKYWKEVYLKQSEEVKIYGTAYRWTFDVRTFCDHTDYMITICEDFNNIFDKLEELHNIFKTNLRFFVEDMKELNILKNRVFGMTVIIQYVQFEIFDPNCKTEWQRVLEGFFNDVKSFENEVTKYLQTLFQSSLSWENAYILSESFDKVSVSHVVKRFVAESYSDMLKQFIKEIAEVEKNFIASERNPPIFGELPEMTSTMLWIQDLSSKISGPVTQICNKNNLSEKEMKVYERFQKTELLFNSYKKKKYEAWKVSSCDKLNAFLQTKVLQKIQISSTDVFEKTHFEDVISFEVNLPLHLEHVSIDAQVLERFGYEIPQFVKNLILQKGTFYRFRNKMKSILEDLKNSLAELRREEISVLGLPVANLCSVLNPGINSICWESTDIPKFIRNMKQAVDIFRGLITQVKIVTSEIESRIKLLSTCDLFQFDDVTNGISTCERYFSDVLKAGDYKVEKMVQIHDSLEMLLRNLEMISCHTNTGKSENLKEYYLACEEKILLALLKVMLDNLEYFNEEILPHYLFPYVDAALESKDELILCSLRNIKLVFIVFLQDVVESPRRIIRWLDGSCILSSSFYVPEIEQKMEFSYFLDLSLHPGIKKLSLSIIKKFFSYVDNKVDFYQ